MAKLLKMGDGLYLFHCPGCGYGHHLSVPLWNWNGSMDAPTATPSLLVNPQWPEQRCHFFITDGKLHFCSDCHHSLAGQIIEMVEVGVRDVVALMDALM